MAILNSAEEPHVFKWAYKTFVGFKFSLKHAGENYLTRFNTEHVVYVQHFS